MIRGLTMIVAGAAAVAAVPAAAQRPSGEDQLQRVIGDRVAGEAVDCIDLPYVRNSRVIERTALVYGDGSTIYVNRPRSGAQRLRRWKKQDGLTSGRQLCSHDLIKIVGSTSNLFSGFVLLGEFVPYRRIRN